MFSIDLTDGKRFIIHSREAFQDTTVQNPWKVDVVSANGKGSYEGLTAAWPRIVLPVGFANGTFHICDYLEKLHQPPGSNEIEKGCPPSLGAAFIDYPPR